MNSEPGKGIGFRPTTTWQTDVPGVTGWVPWRLWIGPLLIVRTPRIGLGVSIGWTR